MILRRFNAGSGRADELCDLERDPDNPDQLSLSERQAVVRELMAILWNWGVDAADRLAVELAARHRAQH